MDVFGKRHAKIVQLAERQWGHIARWQLLGLGVPSRTIGSWVARGLLIPVHAGVYVVGHRRLEARALAAAALLACGPRAVLSHETAAALWGLIGRWPRRPEVSSSPRRRVRIDGIRHHRTRTLRSRDVRTHQGLKVTSPARTIADLRPRLNRRAYVRLINDARLKGLISGGQATALNPETGATHAPTRSAFEDDVIQTLRSSGLPAFQVNARLPGGREVDLLFAAQRVIVELDGYRYHADRDSYERDRIKDAEALARGYVTVRITWRRWQRHRAEVLRELARVVALHGRGAA